MKKQKIIKSLQKRIKNFSTIDIVGLFVIVFLTATAYFFLNRKVEYLDVTLQLLNWEGPEHSVGGNRSRSWYVEKIIPGKKQQGSFGETLIEIIDVYSYPDPSVYQSAYVTLRIKIAQNRTTKQYIYNGSPLLIHDIRSFKVQDLLINGEIIDMSDTPQQFGKFEIELELKNQDPFNNNSLALVNGVKNYIADAVKAGMTIEDSKGRKLVTIQSVEKSPGEKVLATPNGQISIVDPDRTQVKITADVLGEKINNIYFYRKESPLILNQWLYLAFNQIVLIGTITSIEPI